MFNRYPRPIPTHYRKRDVVGDLIGGFCIALIAIWTPYILYAFS